jgi:hypothetical protein
MFWYILWLFGIFPPVLVGSIKKNLATLLRNETAKGKRAERM